MKFEYNDGGRAAAGYKGEASDCVARAIATATGLPYQEVYDNLAVRNQQAGGKRSARNGLMKKVYEAYILDLGWEWVPTMKFGQGCTTHLREDELPSGTLIVRLSRHLAVVRDGVLLDTHDCSRNGTRCVYGYWRMK